MENKYIKESDVFKIVNDFRVQASNLNERKIYTQILIALMSKSYPIRKNEIYSAINKFRNKCHRCRTCAHASIDGIYWFCEAKAIRHCGSVYDTRFAGMFCRLYTPDEMHFKKQ